MTTEGALLQTPEPVRSRPRERIPASLRTGAAAPAAGRPSARDGRRPPDRPGGATPATLTGRAGAAGPSPQPPVSDRATDRNQLPSAVPVAGSATGRGGIPSAASPVAGRSGHPADATRRLVAGASVIATLIMVGTMARTAAEQHAADTAADTAAAAGVAGPAPGPLTAGSPSSDQAAGGVPGAGVVQPGPGSLPTSPPAEAPAATVPRQQAPAPLATVPTPRATQAPAASTSRAS